LDEEGVGGENLAGPFIIELSFSNRYLYGQIKLSNELEFLMTEFDCFDV
jgi:hypothetical protein